ncbi:MAG: TetR/AcrR family transcriptional regulator [Clostridiales bacterium]|nr:TetR/AcrR family transcriptional regulator [Clostridiales bacterium]
MQGYLNTPNDKEALQIKKHILQIAIILFSKKGYYNSTFEELSKIADINIESLYQIYNDKKDLFYECFEIYINRLKKELALDSLGSLNRKDRVVSQLINNYFKAYKVMPEFQKQIMAVGMTNNDFSKHISSFESEIQGHLSRALTNWGRELKAVDIYVAAFFIHNILESTITKAIFNEMRILDENLKKELFDLIYNYLFV